MPLHPLTTAEVEAKVAALAPRFRKAVANDDESDASLKRIGNFHKTLDHGSEGYVDPAQYDAMLAALGAPDLATMDAGLPRFSPASVWLTNPAAGLAHDLEGVDPRLMPFAKAPSVKSEQAAVEMKEVYWMSLLRDVAFTDYPSNPTVAAAVADLNANNGAMNYLGKKDVNAQRLFRGNDIFGADLGPYISQFMYQDLRFGSQMIGQPQETSVPGVDYMMDETSFVAVQNGLFAGRIGQDQIDPQRRFIRNGRDLGHYVHVDALYQAYFNGLLVLLAKGAGNDRRFPYPTKRMAGFGTFGGPHILSLVTEVATRALKAVWYQKWFVHRRLRPEAYGGLVHINDPNLHPAITGSPVIGQIQARTGGTRLLPMAFPEGSPTHPAYGAGHATVAGACVTILKAWFVEEEPMLKVVVPNVEGTALIPYTGPGATELTVGGELNKLAANIALGRNFAGVHWFSDYAESIRLGERVATIVLAKQSRDYFENFEMSYTNFDGKKVKIKNGEVDVVNDAQLEAFYRLHGNLFVVDKVHHELT